MVRFLPDIAGVGRDLEPSQPFIVYIPLWVLSGTSIEIDDTERRLEIPPISLQ